MPPWNPTHPDHATFRSQIEADGWVMMPRAEYAASLEQAAEAGEQLRERLVGLAVPDTAPGIRPFQDASTQNSRAEEVRMYSERIGRRTRLHLHVGAEIGTMDPIVLDQSRP